MPVVHNTEAGVRPKWKHHFPLSVETKLASGTGQSRQSKKALLKDRFGNLLGTFDSKVEAERRSKEIQADPDLLEGLVPNKEHASLKLDDKQIEAVRKAK